MKRILKPLCKVVCFLAVFSLLFGCASAVFNSTEDYRHQNWIRSFYAQPQDSLDAVYVGSSATYAFWCAPLAWGDYGITVHPFATSGQRLLMTKYVIEEARKTQPDALYIINMNTTSTKYTTAHIHYLSDEMPLSINKLRMIRELCDYTGFDKTEFIVPLYLYHTRWSGLNASDFDFSYNAYMGAATYSGFLSNSVDVSEEYEPTTQKTKPSDEYMRQLRELLDYIDENEVKALFVYSIQAIDAERMAYFNYVSDYLQEDGREVLNMFASEQEIGVDFTTDFYNSRHTNIRGAIKTTDHLAKYLVSRYGFADKREEPGYESWDRSFEAYCEKITA